MKGRISIQWKVAQEMFKSVMPNYRGFDKEMWASKVITGIWSIFRQIWNARNMHLHTEMAESYSSTLDKQVRKAFSLQHLMFVTDQPLFHMPLTDRLHTSTESKALWLRSVPIAIHDFTVVHRRTPCQPTITTYFQSTDTVDTTASVTSTTAHSPLEDGTDFIPALI
eukprot:6040476-Ditylum_brightwellii.AAC.3